MLIIESKVSRTYPAHGIAIQKGLNEFDSLPDVVRASVQRKVESGVMRLVEDVAPIEAAAPKRRRKAAASDDDEESAP